MSKKVEVTGLDFITGLGFNAEECWQGLIEGKSGVRKIKTFDTSNVDTKIASEIDESFHEYAKAIVSRYIDKQITKVTKSSYVAAKQAIEKSRLNIDDIDKERIAIIMGIVSTGYSSIEQVNCKGNRIIKAMNNAVPAWISLEYKIEGPSYTIATACASSAYAIGAGYDLISSGRADVVIVGGADSIVNPEEITGFNKLLALSTRNDEPEKASCPFSKERDGFVIGEGAGVLILESEDFAKARKAEIYAEIAGYAFTSEAYNIMSPKKDGEGMAKTMRLAMKNANVSANEIDYINAHGTSTLLNDKYETLAIKEIFGKKAYDIPVSSSKSMIGHTIGAAGAIEAAITVLSIKNGILTPTINYNPDPELDLDYVPNKAREKKISVALSNSFAFGGHNATIVFRKYT